MLTDLLLYLIGAIVAIPFIYFVWMHTTRLSRKDADALIVLGYRCDNGRIHPLLQDRLDTTLSLFSTHQFRYVILSGGAVKSNRTEAEIMQEYLVNHGIPKERILLETMSRNTVHNLVNCGILMKEYGLKTCLLVSNSFHIRRMKFIMRALNMPSSFYANRKLTTVIRQWKLTFQEIRAFRLTLPWIEKALNMESPQMMGSKKGVSIHEIKTNNQQQTAQID